MWRAYRGLLTSHPLFTKSTTSAALMSTADACCQTYERETAAALIDNNGTGCNMQDGCPTYVSYTSADHVEANRQMLLHDWTRTCHVAVTGLLFAGPISHAWYGLLEKVVRVQHQTLAVALKLALDAAIFSPIAVAGYFSMRTFLEGGGVDGIVRKLRLKWLSALQASWSFWPAANVINFSIVPVPLRVLYNNVLSLGWNAFLSRLNAERLEQVVRCPSLQERQALTHVSLLD